MVTLPWTVRTGGRPRPALPGRPWPASRRRSGAGPRLAPRVRIPHYPGNGPAGPELAAHQAGKVFCGEIWELREGAGQGLAKRPGRAASRAEARGARGPGPSAPKLVPDRAARVPSPGSPATGEKARPPPPAPPLAPPPHCPPPGKERGRGRAVVVATRSVCAPSSPRVPPWLTPSRVGRGRPRAARSRFPSSRCRSRWWGSSKAPVFRLRRPPLR